MKYALTSIATAAALAVIALAPCTAEAGWRGGWGPGFGIYIGPPALLSDYSYRYRYRTPYYRPMVAAPLSLLRLTGRRSSRQAFRVGRERPKSRRNATYRLRRNRDDVTVSGFSQLLLNHRRTSG